MLAMAKVALLARRAETKGFIDFEFPITTSLMDVGGVGF